MTTLVWFRQDLRTSDHDALLDACARGAVVPVFIWYPKSEGRSAAHSAGGCITRCGGLLMT